MTRQPAKVTRATATKKGNFPSESEQFHLRYFIILFAVYYIDVILRDYKQITAGGSENTFIFDLEVKRQWRLRGGSILFRTFCTPISV